MQFIKTTTIFTSLVLAAFSSTASISSPTKTHAQQDNSPSTGASGAPAQHELNVQTPTPPPHSGASVQIQSGSNNNSMQPKSGLTTPHPATLPSTGASGAPGQHELNVQTPPPPPHSGASGQTQSGSNNNSMQPKSSGQQQSTPIRPSPPKQGGNLSQSTK